MENNGFYRWLTHPFFLEGEELWVESWNSRIVSSPPCKKEGNGIWRNLLNRLELHTILTIYSKMVIRLYRLMSRWWNGGFSGGNREKKGFKILEVNPWSRRVETVSKYLGGGFNYFYFHPYLGRWSQLTNIFEMGWNHQLDMHHISYDDIWWILKLECLLDYLGNAYLILMCVVFSF